MLPWKERDLYEQPLPWSLGRLDCFGFFHVFFCKHRDVAGKTFVLSGERLGRLMVQSAQDQASTMDGLDGY